MDGKRGQLSVEGVPKGTEVREPTGSMTMLKHKKRIFCRRFVVVQSESLLRMIVLIPTFISR